MLRDRFTRVRKSEGTTLTAGERRRFRRLQRGLRVADPRWYAQHCPRQHRRRRLTLWAAGMLSLLLVILGGVTGTMPVVLCGVVMAFAAVTGHVSGRLTRKARQPHT